jgi:hypothetical protein
MRRFSRLSGAPKMAFGHNGNTVGNCDRNSPDVTAIYLESATGDFASDGKWHSRGNEFDPRQLHIKPRR